MFFFNAFFFFFFFEETRPRMETEGMTLPQPPEGTGQKRRFSKKIWKSGWTKRSLILFCPALMQLGRENLCAAKNTGDGRKERYDKEKSV